MLRAIALLGIGAFITLAAATLSAQEKSATDPRPQPMPKYEETTLSKFSAAKAGNPSVLFIGDSITEQWLNPQKGTPVWTEKIKPLNAGNFGFGGDTTNHVIWRIEKVDWAGVAPKVIVLMIGTNNGDKGETLLAGQKKIVQMLNERCPAAQIIFHPVLPRDKGFTGKTLIFETNALAPKLVEECKNVTILDLTEKFLGEDKQIKKELYADGLHLSTEGYKVWADALLPVIGGMLK